MATNHTRRVRPHVVERRAHRRAEREAPTGGHPLRWFALIPFQGRASLEAWAAVRNRCNPPQAWQDDSERAIRVVGQLGDLRRDIRAAL